MIEVVVMAGVITGLVVVAQLAVTMAKKGTPVQVNPVNLLRRIRLPGYHRRAPDPVSVGVMAPGLAPVRGWSSRKQRRYDHLFWGIIHDHNWLQYDPPRGDE